MPPATMPRQEVLAVLGLADRSADRQRKRLAELSARHSFPRSLPGLDVWSRDLVLAWIKTNGGREAAAGEVVMTIADAHDQGARSPSNYVRESLRRLEARVNGDFAPAEI